MSLGQRYSLAESGKAITEYLLLASLLVAVGLSSDIPLILSPYNFESHIQNDSAPPGPADPFGAGGSQTTQPQDENDDGWENIFWRACESMLGCNLSGVNYGLDTPSDGPDTGNLIIDDSPISWDPPSDVLY